LRIIPDPNHRLDPVDDQSTTPASPVAARPPRQPTRTRTTGLILIAFVIVVRFVAPGQLPLFFQRLVGIVCALLAMLLVVFAIREYGKKYNRLRWPLLGRVSSSKVVGTIVFLAVLGLWLSPWAPIQPIQSEPDLWRFLEQGLDAPLVVLADRNRAIIAPPVPSEAARLLSANVTPESPTFPRALRAVVESKFEEADELLDRLAQNESHNAELLELVRAARAAADLYAGRYDEASRRYRELLADQPRREVYLARAALSAALAGDYATAEARAKQLLDQAGTRRREAVPYRQAVNLLVAINAAQGHYEEAKRLGDQTKASRERAMRDDGVHGELDPQVVADVNNQAVLAVLTAAAATDVSSAGFESTKRLAADWNDANNLPRDSANLLLAVPSHNQGMAELFKENFTLATQSLNDALAIERRLGEGPSKRMIDLTSEALARAGTQGQRSQ
jgi:tetratricopeptide (TPR) repeat protein